MLLLTMFGHKLKATVGNNYWATKQLLSEQALLIHRINFLTLTFNFNLIFDFNLEGEKICRSQN